MAKGIFGSKDSNLSFYIYYTLGNPYRFMKKLILIIENDQDILDITGLILEEIGFKVICSRTANILDQVLQIKPDLILLDDWLEGRSGHEHCKLLKSEQTTKHIPVVIFSVLNNLEKTAMDCFADGYIIKPFDIAFLQQEVNRILQLNDT
jgi:DNA-binding response OmpR family regulator